MSSGKAAASIGFNHDRHGRSLTAAPVDRYSMCILGTDIGECTTDCYRAIFVDDSIVNAQAGNNRRRITDSYAVEEVAVPPSSSVKVAVMV